MELHGVAHHVVRVGLSVKRLHRVGESKAKKGVQVLPSVWSLSTRHALQ